MLKHTQPRLSQLASAVAVVLGGITLLPAAHAAAPAAGVSISNIAIGTYNDINGTPLTVNSNQVSTTVLQVASFTLEADRNDTVNPNGQVSLSHTLRNTGNAPDTFVIDLANLGVSATDQIDLSNIAVYLDANGDGVPDNNIDLATLPAGQGVTVAPGASVNLLVVGQAPINATTGQAAQLTLTATSGFDSAVTDTDTDTVTIVGGPDIDLAKSVSVAVGADNRTSAGDVVTYTIAYKNNGNSSGVNVVITDLLPANVTYVPGSAVWSSQAGALTDGVDGDAYDFDAVGRDLTLTIPTVAPNTNGTLTFQVTIDAAAPEGDIINTAFVDYDDGDAGTPPVIDKPSNQSIFPVDAVSLGTINDSTNDPFADGVAPGVGATPVAGDLTVDDVQNRTIPQGGTAVFTTVVHNTGNVEQIYEVVIDQTDLPAGSSVQVLRNGSPLTNISGTNTVDVGPVAVGGTAVLEVRITLPSGFSETLADTNDTIITIVPVGNAAATDSTTLVIDNVTPATVDLSNGAVTDYTDATVQTADGEGPYNPAVIVDDQSTTPGVPVTFPVEIYNGGNSADSFNLTATVPPGWTVVFKDAAGNVVTNSGSIPPGTTVDLFATVTPPNNALVDPTNDVVLTVTSPVSGLTDSIKNNVAITEDREITFTPDRIGQIAPGGTVVYSHTLTNAGNVVEGDALGELPLAVNTAGIAGVTVTVGVDLDNDGVLDNNEIVQGGDLNSVVPAGLLPFTSYTVLVKVEAPTGALVGQQEITTVTVTPTGAINGVAAPAVVDIVDTTTVAVPVRLVKTQSVDANCDGVSDSGTYGLGTISAEPGQCVVYRIVATNEGSSAVNTLVITDSTPAFTTIDTPATAIIGAAAPVAATVPGVVDQAGTVSHDVGVLAPAATAQLDFGVEIDK